MSSLPSSFLCTRNPHPRFISGSSLKPNRTCLLNISPTNLSCKQKIAAHRRTLTVRAGMSTFVSDITSKGLACGKVTWPSCLESIRSKGGLPVASNPQSTARSLSNLCGKATLDGSHRLKPQLSKGKKDGDGARPSNASIFIGGFVLGGIVVGTLGCIYAPQISKALTGADRKDLMRKLPKFIYDEEKALEKTRKVLTEKIEQLNSAIDDLSAQLHANDAPNGSAVNSDEVEASL